MVAVTGCGRRRGKGVRVRGGFASGWMLLATKKSLDAVEELVKIMAVFWKECVLATGSLDRASLLICQHVQDCFGGEMLLANGFLVGEIFFSSNPLSPFQTALKEQGV
jgi:hypothetical protein